jgi:hypothetical protein
MSVVSAASLVLALLPLASWAAAAAPAKVADQNHPPTDITLTPSAVPENAPAGTFVGNLQATDPDLNDEHTFALVSGAGSRDNGSFTILGSRLHTAASFDFEAKRTLSIRVRATDKAGNKLVLGLTVTVTDVFENAAPVAADDTRAATEDTLLTLPVSGAGSPAANDTDADRDPLAVTAVSGAAGGTAAIVSGMIRFTPAADLCGPARGGFDYTVSDTHGGTDQGRVTVDITCVPDDPAASDDTATVAEDAAPTPVPALANDTDAEGDPLKIGSVTQPTNGSVMITGDGTGLTYEPDRDYCNSDAGPDDTFNYNLTPGADTATVSVTVTCVADDPVAVDDSATVAEDSGASAIDVLINDNDVDGGAKSVDSVTQPAQGTVVITDGGAGLSYEPDPGSCSSGEDPNDADTFTYTLAPGGDTATVSVTVTCDDDLPTAVDDTAAVTEDATLAVDVLANDIDPDGGSKSVVSVTQPANGTVVIHPDGGGLTYEPDANYCNSPPGATPDTFTYALNGGDTGSVSVTVTCVNDPPVADDETFTGADAAVGNTVLVVNDPSDGPPSQSGPKKSITGDILAGDTDIDGPGPLTVTAGTFATNDGGSVTIESDGDFVFTPAAGSSCTDRSDFFDYTVEDSGAPAQTDTGRVTISITDCAWYVSNNAAGNAGTSTAPFDTLAQAQAASAAGQTIFVFHGDGSSSGYDRGIALKANQALLSEGADLILGGAFLHQAQAGKRPTLTNNNADVVELDDANFISGFVIDPQGTGRGIAGATGDTGGGTIDNVWIRDTGTPGSQPMLELDSTAGTFNVRNFEVITLEATSHPDTATGVRLSRAGTVVFAPAGRIRIVTEGAKALDVTSTGLGTSTFDEITVSSPVGGVALTNTTGTTVKLGDGLGGLGIRTTGTAPAFLLDNAANVTVSSGGFDAVYANGGPGVQVTGAATLFFDDVQSANSSTDGISLENFGTGTFSAGWATATPGISGAAAVGFDLDGGSGDVSYGGPISASGSGRPVQITHRTGGTALFGGEVSSTGAGVELLDNGGGAGGTIRFDGGLALTTQTNDAFTATGGGTVAVTDPTPAGIAPDNTLTTSGGRALNVANTTIDADGLTFRSITSDGAVNGILLDSTGALGGLTVTGNGGTCSTSANCSGGSIRGSTESGVVLNSTTGTSLTRMHIQNSNEDGIEGSSVTGLDLTDSVITANGDDSEDVGIGLDNLWGTSAWSSVSVTDSELANVMIDNTSGTLDSFTVSGASQFDSLGTALGESSVLIVMRDSAVMTSGSIDGATFADNHPARGITVQAQGSGRIGDAATNSFTLQKSTFTNNGLHASFEQSDAADLTFRMLDNDTAGAPMTMPGTSVATSHAVNVVSSPTSTGGAIRGRISGNHIGDGALAGSGSAVGNGIRALIQGRTLATLLLDSNVIRQTPQARGIDVRVAGPTDGSAGGTSDVTVTNNDVNPQDATGFPASAIHVAAGSPGGGTVTLRTDIRGNIVPAGVAVDSLPTFIALDEVAAAAGCELVDTAPSSADASAQLTSTNTGSASAAAGCALIGGPIGTPP